MTPALLSLIGALALADAPPAKLPPPSDADCHALPAMHPPWSFGPGETLDFQLDAMGATAGRMTMRVLSEEEGLLPVEVHAETNTFFSKVRRVHGTGTSYLDPHTLRPVRYAEDAVENEVPKTAEVSFDKNRWVRVNFTIGAAAGEGRFRYAHDGLDVAGAIYAIRQLPLKAGLPVCFDIYGIRTLWRVSGKVGPKEHVSLPIGEFDAWHLSGNAVKLDDYTQQREIHVWVTDDARRLPLAALGVIDLGAIRATLTGFERPGEKRIKSDKANMRW